MVQAFARRFWVAESILISIIWVVLAAILFSGRLIPSMCSSHRVPSMNSVIPYQHCVCAAHILILRPSYSFTAKTFVGRRLSKTLQSVSIALAVVVLSCCTHPIKRAFNGMFGVLFRFLTRPLRQMTPGQTRWTTIILQNYLRQVVIRHVP